MKKMVFLSALVLFFSASVAKAACTPEQVQQKAIQVTTQLQALAQKDPAKMQKLMEDFQKKGAELAGKADMDAACKYYDEMIAASK
jgi:hypothetical protein